MMKKHLFLILVLFNVFATFAQTTTLTFTGRDGNSQYIRLDRVVVSNLTQNWQETICYPDTVLEMGTTGIKDFDKVKDFKLFQNYPNPFDGFSDFCLSVPEGGKVTIDVVSLDGRTVAKYQGCLSVGIHSFRVKLNNPQNYIVTARSGKEATSIKITNNGDGGLNEIQYVGEDKSFHNMLQWESAKGQSTHNFQNGDRMSYVGYFVKDGVELISQEIIQEQFTSENLVLNFIDGLPCPGMATTTDHEGNVYNTVMIGDQCWMRENMRCSTSPSTGTVILLPNDNLRGTYSGKGAYYVNRDSSNTNTYGLLYNWNAAVDTFNTSFEEISFSYDSDDAVDVTFVGNRRGICPQGWHVPSDSDWTALTDYVAARSAYNCNGYSTNVAHIAKALAATTGWESDENGCSVGNESFSNNATGFTAVPAGKYAMGFDDFGEYAFFWSSTQNNDYRSHANYRRLDYNDSKVNCFDNGKEVAYSVRCLRD